ncbi:FAD-binding oxidoreductase [Endozoicomonas sp. GU-1]|uniref:FAD-binding oxidoreductase n=1 Tax=Endozoicomonas sp. GU-1 TaxID=3009078 RepID=UPI0022B51446|nr:FAD-binding oxidoreductase [Endozoicomonas sp. GU-1]WBA83227.1 FAD-binding oxidoreductase [Endozoicomonas sp. GU-1]WBA86152.1 FAD-binding oxidoreductase [Endozoicomonas sp. GU-1]
MRRWNGWGDESYVKEVSDHGDALIRRIIGEPTPLKDATLESVIARVPPSRLPEHPLIVTAAEDRVRHARGQSFPDWLAMRSGDFGVFPDGVAYPETSAQVRELLALAVQHDFIVIPYGGGTSVAGHITPQKNTRAILTIDMGHMNQLMDLNEESQIATFGAGTPGPQVEAQLQARGYTLGHYPQSWELSTIGGWIASRSSGQQSLRYGRIEQMFAGGRMETLQGTLDIPSIPASSAGPDIRELTMGTEGRLGIFTEVKVRVQRAAEEEKFMVCFMPNWQAGKAVAREVAQQKIPLSMMRVSNAKEARAHAHLGTSLTQFKLLDGYLRFRGLDDNRCMLTFGVTGSEYQNKVALKQLGKILKKHGGVGGTLANIMGTIWAHGRFKFPYLRETTWARGIAVDTLETSTDWENVDSLMHQMEASLENALKDEGENVMAFTHLSHIYGQGSSIYTTYFFRCADSYEATLARWKKLKAKTSEVIAQGYATISHQHGTGRDHAPYMLAEKGELGMRMIATLVHDFDPDKRLNPGVLLQDSE